MIDIPGYRVERELGEGGMARVYVAIQESLDRPVAMKVLSSDLVSDQEFCARFLREGKTLARVSHPNVVRIIDCGEHNGVFFMTMELMPGGTLTDRLEAGELRVGESIEIVKRIASALEWSHGKGLIHRDVKPANVLFSEDGSPVLGDFGIAKTLRQDTTQMTALGVAIGTPTYMSPEQASAKELTPKSDQYSLGVMLFEMLTGKPPYEGKSAFDVASKHIQASVPELPANVRHFQHVINRMMAKDPALRYDTMEELAMALDGVSTGGTEYFEAPKNKSLPVYLIAGGSAAAVLIIATAWYVSSRSPSPAPADENGAGLVVAPQQLDAASPPSSTDPEVVKWLEIAQTHFDIGRLFDPPGNNALEAYWKVIEVDAINAEALAGLGNIAELLAPLAKESMENGDIEESRFLVQKGLQANPKNKSLMELQEELNDL